KLLAGFILTYQSKKLSLDVHFYGMKVFLKTQKLHRKQFF
ncbi:MAG: hypothetical protein ACI8VJ_000667, partial [Polaribacter sp.]